MADTVKVNGVELTRAQVEQAMKDLNAPPVLKAFPWPTRVRLKMAGRTSNPYFVVPSPPVLNALDKLFYASPCPAGQQTLICCWADKTHGYTMGGTYRAKISDLEEV